MQFKKYFSCHICSSEVRVPRSYIDAGPILSELAFQAHKDGIKPLKPSP